MASDGVHVRRHPNGRRYVRIYVGTNPVNGRQIRPYRSFPDDMTDEEVEAEARTWAAQQRAAWRYGTAMRLDDVLTSYIGWLEDEHTAANTLKSYRSIVRTRLKGIAGRDPRAVTARMASDLYHELLVSGSADGEELSPNTVRQVHWFLRGAFDWMVERGLVATNPILSASVPRLAPHEAVALDEDDLTDAFAALDAAISEDPADARGVRRRMHLFAAWLALHTGMRCGECCAVRRADVRRAQGIVRVTGTIVDAGAGVVRQPATKGHRPRNIAVSDADMARVAEHMAWQRDLLGDAPAKRVLVSADGDPCRPGDVSATFTAFARELGLPAGATFHSLRHTHGTWLLMQGVPIKAVSERLGHADVATTLRIYAHVLPGLDQAAAEGFSSLEREMRGEK